MGYDEEDFIVVIRELFIFYGTIEGEFSCIVLFCYEMRAIEKYVFYKMILTILKR